MKNVEEVDSAFPNLDDAMRQDLQALLSGRAVGKCLMHTWYDQDTKCKKVYAGRIEKEKKMNGVKYIVAYWLPDAETYAEDAEDTPMTKFELGADLISGDLSFCHF